MAKQVSANPARRELDMLLSAGERIAMALLSIAIRELGGDAISFTGSQSGIITNDRHVDARIIEVRPFRVQDELARGRVVVVAGYQGVSYRREVTTLGRGGSDTTAVAMAAALGAEWCEICSDVDGVYTADPRVVADARRIGVLSYEETQELAESGAKVLNAQAVEFARKRDRDLRPRHQRDRCRGPTLQRRHGGAKEPAADAGTVVGVASRARRARPGSKSAGVPRTGARGRRSCVSDEHGVASKQLHMFCDRTQVVISRENLHDEARLRDALARRLDGGAQLVDGLAAVSVIGAGINASYANVRTGSQALAESGIQPAGIAIVFPELLDDSSRQNAGRRPGAPPALHRVHAPLLP
jgi:aspartate kinase